jgi:hypothetical protein
LEQGRQLKERELQEVKGAAETLTKELETANEEHQQLREKAKKEADYAVYRVVNASCFASQ